MSAFQDPCQAVQNPCQSFRTHVSPTRGSRWVRNPAPCFRHSIRALLIVAYIIILHTCSLLELSLIIIIACDVCPEIRFLIFFSLLPSHPAASRLCYWGTTARWRRLVSRSEPICQPFRTHVRTHVSRSGPMSVLRSWSAYWSTCLI